MTNYNTITGHITSPHANFGEDDDEFPYVVTVDDKTYKISAVGPRTAERKARKLYESENGRAPVSVKVVRE